MFRLQRCHPSVVNDETALATSLRLNSGVGATVIKLLAGASGSLSLCTSVLESGSWVLVCSVFVLVGLKMCFPSEDSMGNAVLSAN